MARRKYYRDDESVEPIVEAPATKEESEGFKPYVGRITNCISVNIREGMSTGYPVVKTAKAGDRVNVIEEILDYSRVEIGSVKGYLPSLYVTKI